MWKQNPSRIGRDISKNNLESQNIAVYCNKGSKLFLSISQPILIGYSFNMAHFLKVSKQLPFPTSVYRLTDPKREKFGYSGIRCSLEALVFALRSSPQSTHIFGRGSIKSSKYVDVLFGSPLFANCCDSLKSGPYDAASLLLTHTHTADVLALKHESRILGQWSNSKPVSGSRKNQASSPWAKQHIVQPVPSWRNHIQK